VPPEVRRHGIKKTATHLQSNFETSGDEHVAVKNMFGRDFVYVLGGVIPLAVSALFLPALTRLMGRREFGVVSLAVAVSWIMYIVLAFGMQTAVQREFPKRSGPRHAREMIAVVSVCIFLLSAGLAASAHEWAGVVSASRFPWAMELMSAWSGAAAITLICLGFLRSADRLRPFMAVVLVQSVGAQVIGVLLLLANGHSAREYIVGLLIGQVAAALIALGFVRPRFARTMQVGTLGRALSFSLPLVPNQLANFLLWSGDRFVVQRDLGSIAQARYAVAYAVGAMAINVTSQLNQAWMPRVFAIHDVTQRRTVLAQVQRRLMGLLSPSVLAVSLAVPFLLILASPQSYRSDTLVLVTVLIVPTALPYSVALANTRTLLAHGKSGRLAASTFTCAALNIGLNVLWVPRFGLIGSAAATLVSYACQAWLSGVLVRSEADRLPDRLRSELSMWMIVAGCIVTAFIPGGGIGTVARVVALCGAVTVIAVSLRHSRKRNGHRLVEPVAATAQCLED